MSLIALLTEYGQKQEELRDLREDEMLQGLGNTEQHILAAVGDLPEPNVTAIAEYMGITKGAVSKNIRKMIFAGYLEAFQKEGNSKNIYYALTEQGRELYLLHQKAHENWIRADQAFFDTLSPEERRAAEEFFRKYLAYMDQQIREMERQDG